MPLTNINVKRILVCQLRQIGDVLLATPAVEMLAKHFPDAQLHFYTEKKCLPMLQHNPHIDHIWELDKKKLPTLVHEISYYRQIAKTGYDLVVDFQQLPRIRWVVAMSKAAVRLSFPPPWYLRFLYTHWHQPEQAYAAIFKAGILMPLGITWQGERPRLYLTETEKQEAQRLLHHLGIIPCSEHLLITVDPTHRYATRRWPAEHYAKLIDTLADLYPKARFLLSYGPGEGPEVQRIQALCMHPEKVCIPPTMLTLRQLAACMEHASLHLGNCSSPRHIAVAMDLPSFTILGSTSPGWTYPSPEHTHIRKGLPCQACNKNTCNIKYECLTSLTPKEVAPKVIAHLTQYGKNIPPDLTAK